MHCGRHYFAGGFGPDGLIYVAGGFEWTGMLTSAERSALHTSPHPSYSMLGNRAAPSPADGPCLRWVPLAHRYDPRKDRWADLPDMGASMEMCSGAFVW